MSDGVKEGQDHSPGGIHGVKWLSSTKQLFLICSLKGCSVSGQCNAIPACFTQKMTEFPLGNSLATGIQLVWVDVWGFRGVIL